MQQVEIRHAFGVVDDAFTVDQRRRHLQPAYGGNDTRKAVGSVGAPASKNPYAVLNFPHHEPVAGDATAVGMQGSMKPVRRRDCMHGI